MPISFSCTACNRMIKIPDELAGRKAKCPGCKAVLFIPEAPQGVDDSHETLAAPPRAARI